jgi:hypothetical protein
MVLLGIGQHAVQRAGDDNLVAHAGKALICLPIMVGGYMKA